ncbi:Uncharacterised protein [Mycobacteroides abscessus subsp. abscessus]|nr:Uncharacterised protein [Mycobacteroides abscessus subsp. abscessus]
MNLGEQRTHQAVVTEPVGAPDGLDDRLRPPQESLHGSRIQPQGGQVVLIRTQRELREPVDIGSVRRSNGDLGL